MAAFFDKFASQRARDRGPKARSAWGQSASSQLRGYMGRLGKLQGEVRREMGSWLDTLNNPDAGLQTEIHTQVEDVKRRLNTTLTGLEKNLQLALTTVNDRLARPADSAEDTTETASPIPTTTASPSMASLPTFSPVASHATATVTGTLRQDDPKGHAAPTVTAATVTGTLRQDDPKGAQPRVEEARLENRAAQPRMDGVLESGPAVYPAAEKSEARDPPSRPLSRPIIPPLVPVQGTPAVPVEHSATVMVSQRHVTSGTSGRNGTSASNGMSETSVPLVHPPPAPRGSAITSSLRNASARIGKAIQEEGGAPMPSASWGVLSTEQQQLQEAQMLADWLADR